MPQRTTITWTKFGKILSQLLPMMALSFHSISPWIRTIHTTIKAVMLRKEHIFLQIITKLVLLLHNNTRTHNFFLCLIHLILHLFIAKTHMQLTPLTTKAINQPTMVKTAKKLPPMTSPKNCPYFPLVWTKKIAQYMPNMCLFWTPKFVD